MSHLIRNYSDASPVERSRGGLAAWQERIAKEILFARMRDPPAIDELSQACGVSPAISSGLSASPPDTRRTNG
jgi:hypothetical protein